MIRVVLASNNRGKVREFSQVLAGCHLDIHPQAELGVTAEVEETGGTFVENAILKARHAARITGLPALADDSGIEVDALRGAPGIRSARFAGDSATDAENVELLLARLAGVPDEARSARFQCLLVYMSHHEDPTPVICQGTWEGAITRVPAGDNGFGYDPVFRVPGHGCTAAQLDAEVKNRLSHRGQALGCLVARLAHLAG
ncbi:MAG: RdgB/HAM1 family non-canonical purine NTP pyrophosphatase [Gammaproteobacteria bacterium]|nr:RdgB/HAM1 family non-canonical purine NTP pyrophosphatase [Gammaproteobacteria bacterium]